MINPGLAISTLGLTLCAPRRSRADDSAGAGGRQIAGTSDHWRYKYSWLNMDSGELRKQELK